MVNKNVENLGHENTNPTNFNLKKVKSVKGENGGKFDRREAKRLKDKKMLKF